MEQKMISLKLRAKKQVEWIRQQIGVADNLMSRENSGPGHVMQRTDK